MIRIIMKGLEIHSHTPIKKSCRIIEFNMGVNRDVGDRLMYIAQSRD